MGDAKTFSRERELAPFQARTMTGHKLYMKVDTTMSLLYFYVCMVELKK